MKELRLVCRLSNNRLHRARTEMGLTVAELCRRSRISIGSYYKMLSLKEVGRGKRGGVQDIAGRMAEFFGMSVDEMFPPSLALVRQSTAEREIDVADAMCLLAAGGDGPDEIPLLPLEAEVGRQELGGVIHGLLETLEPMEAAVLKARFGLDECGEPTLDEVGENLGLSKGRVQQIEAKALRKLRKPKRAEALEPFLDDDLDRMRKERSMMDDRPTDMMDVAEYDIWCVVTAALVDPLPPFLSYVVGEKVPGTDDAATKLDTNVATPNLLPEGLISILGALVEFGRWGAAGRSARGFVPFHEVPLDDGEDAQILQSAIWSARLHIVVDAENDSRRSECSLRLVGGNGRFRIVPGPRRSIRAELRWKGRPPALRGIDRLAVRLRLQGLMRGSGFRREVEAR